LGFTPVNSTRTVFNPDTKEHAVNVIERATNIILKPAETWAVIEQESGDLQQLYVPYMLVLAAIPAVAGFIGMSIFGIGGFGFSMRIPVLSGLGMMVSQYVMTLVMVFVWGWLVNALASTFNGQPNLMNAVKLAVYASTPSMVAGVLHAIPGLGMLALLGGLYSLYVLYLGLPILMKNPQEKTIPYIAVSAVVGIVGGLLLSFVSAAFMPSPMSRMSGMSGAPGGAAINISTPKGDVQISGQPTAPGAAAGDATMTIKTPDGEVKIDMKNMEELAKRMEAMAAENQKKQ
jgi:hypothetical protein